MFLFMLSSGLTLIFGMMGVLNFAHASFFMLGAYIAYQINSMTNFWIALFLAPLFVAFIGGLTEKFALRRIHKYGHVAELIFTFLQNSYRSSFLSKIGYILSKPALNRFKTRIDPRKYNGAVLLGLNGIVVKSHGGTDAFGFSNAIGVAVSLIENSYVSEIEKKLDF